MGWPTESFEIAEKELETLADIIDRRELHSISDPPQMERREDYREMVRIIREAADTARQFTEKHREKQIVEESARRS